MRRVGRGEGGRTGRGGAQACDSSPRGVDLAAAVQRSVITLRLPHAMALRRRILDGRENHLWKLVARELGADWRSAQSQALGLGADNQDASCRAALRLSELRGRGAARASRRASAHPSSSTRCNERATRLKTVTRPGVRAPRPTGPTVRRRRRQPRAPRRDGSRRGCAAVHDEATFERIQKLLAASRRR